EAVDGGVQQCGARLGEPRGLSAVAAWRCRHGDPFTGSGGGCRFWSELTFRPECFPPQTCQVIKEARRAAATAQELVADRGTRRLSRARAVVLPEGAHSAPGPLHREQADRPRGVDEGR